MLPSVIGEYSVLLLLVEAEVASSEYSDESHCPHGEA